DSLDERALIYETAVAKIRQRRPLVLSVRVLQGMLGAVTAAAMVAGFVVAARSDSAWIEHGYIVVTALAFASFAFSYRHMYMAERVTEETLMKEGFSADRPLWVSRDVHSE